MPRDLAISTLKVALENYLNYVVGQNPRYRGPDEGKDAKRSYSVKACTGKMDLPCTRLPDE